MNSLLCLQLTPDGWGADEACGGAFVWCNPLQTVRQGFNR